MRRFRFIVGREHLELYEYLVRSMADVSREVLEEAGYKAEDVRLFIPHQANQRITDAVADRPLNRARRAAVFRALAKMARHSLSISVSRRMSVSSVRRTIRPTRSERTRTSAAARSTRCGRWP